jgi:glucose-6-phosphate isomerase, archaeal
LSVSLDSTTGVLSGPQVTESMRTLGALAGVYRDEAARSAMDQDRVIYRVQAYEPQPEGSPGAVCLATTFLEPGKVGDEYFMTRGHFHANQDRPELEVTISGEGALILMTQDRHTRVEPMRPGSVHHVPPGTAHRVANTGGETLIFVSYWASETGHDYETIKRQGFGARMREVSGQAELVAEE